MEHHNLRITRQRRLILEELRRERSHLSADEIYEKVKKRLPRISLGTIYRNLNVLSERGIIQTLETGGAQKLFDGDPNDHYHIRCVACGRVDDLRAQPIITIDDSLNSDNDYEIIGYNLEFIGLCPECKKNKAEKRRERRENKDFKDEKPLEVDQLP